MPIVALLSDFGTRDYYVAAMKGMILQINPKATLVDISHEITPQDVFEGAFTLRQALPFFPTGTIFVAVVDPTVGSRRRILAARYNDRIILAPDNGLLTMLQRDAELQEMRIVENRRLFASQLSATFHGRDIFAPVAGHLSRGLPLAEVGPGAAQIEILDIPKPRLTDGGIEGQIVLIDHFGNLITNISELDLTAARSPRVHLEAFVGPQRVGPIRNTYADVAPGEPVAVIGSARMLEVAINSGSAAEKLGARRGDPVQLR